jgi:hypothetical protein
MKDHLNSQKISNPSMIPENEAERYLDLIDKKNVKILF